MRVARRMRIIRMLAEHPEGLSTPEMAREFAEASQPWQVTLTRTGGVLRYMEKAGRVQRAGKVPGAWQRGPADRWRITDAGREWLQPGFTKPAPARTVPVTTQPPPTPLLIPALFARLPPCGEPFPQKARDRWMAALKASIDLIYGDDDE